MSADCRCGSGRSFGACCGPVLDATRPARTAEELMRSRFTAYAVGDADHVFRTWHPRTRPPVVRLDPLAQRWVRLDVVAAEGGGPTDDTGTVEFVAWWTDDAGGGHLHEVSRFARRAGRWFYVDGDVLGEPDEIAATASG